MSLRRINMNEMVAILIQPIKEQDAQHRITFTVEPMPLVFGDLGMISSVWSNLIDNAVKFTRRLEFASITIGAEETEDEIVYHVRDNGVGFDMNYSAKLFNIFQRLHSHEEYEGTGIGLATVRRIVSRHGGRTWAEGKTGEGATFYFSLNKRKESEPT
jgi:chemotaxis family two-component system sensor kinase Cph1